jgi:NADH-quinone oxidoreductase subunit L
VEGPRVHEAPWVMTGPLVVLALGSLTAGALNLPAILPGAGGLHHWLEPVTELGAQYVPEAHLAAATEWTLLAFATLIALAGIVGAVVFLKPARLVRAADAVPEVGLQRLLLRKWYVDELYDATVVRPLVWLSDRVFWRFVDQGVIDGAGVNGSASIARAVGWIGARFQTGQLGTYVFVFVIGAWLILRAVVR